MGTLAAFDCPRFGGGVISIDEGSRKWIGWVHILLEEKGDGGIADDDGGKLQRIYTDELPLFVVAYDLECVGSYLWAPFMVPPEFALDGKASCSVEAAVPMGLAVFDSIHQVCNRATLGNGIIG